MSSLFLPLMVQDYSQLGTVCAASKNATLSLMVFSSVFGTRGRYFCPTISRVGQKYRPLSHFFYYFSKNP